MYVKLILVPFMPTCSASPLISHQTSPPPHCHSPVYSCRLCNCIDLHLHITSFVRNCLCTHFVSSACRFDRHSCLRIPFLIYQVDTGWALLCWFSPWSHPVIITILSKLMWFGDVQTSYCKGLSSRPNFYHLNEFSYSLLKEIITDGLVHC